MKKLLSLILALNMLCGMLAVGAGAETDDTALLREFHDSICEYLLSEIVGNDIPQIELCGYKELEDGTYEVWAYTADHSCVDGEGNTVSYTPAGSDTEGEDYLMLPKKTYVTENYLDLHIDEYTYAPAKILYGIKCIAVRGDEGISLSSLEKLDAAEVPAKSELTPSDLRHVLAVNNGTVFVETDKNSFAEGAQFCIGIPNVHKSPDITGINDEYKISREFTFIVLKDGEEIPLNGDVTVRFPLPGQLYMTDAQLYLGDPFDGGTLIPWENESEGIARITECGMYTIVGTSTILGDADGDGYINLRDVSLILRHIAKWDVQCLESNADVTLDGSVNLADVSEILWQIVYW